VNVVCLNWIFIVIEIVVWQLKILFSSLQWYQSGRSWYLRGWKPDRQLGLRNRNTTRCFSISCCESLKITEFRKKRGNGCWVFWKNNMRKSCARRGGKFGNLGLYHLTKPYPRSKFCFRSTVGPSKNFKGMLLSNYIKTCWVTKW